MAGARDAALRALIAFRRDGAWPESALKDVGSKFVIYRRSEKKAQEAARQARELKKRKSNPVRRGAQERRRQAREERERRNEYFRQAAIQAAIERRKSREE